MIEIDVTLPSDADFAHVEAAVERCCAADGLELARKGTLAAYPGCIHWHYRRGQEQGTLEITAWARNRRLWFKIADGRGGDWIDAAIGRLELALEAALP